MDKANDVTPNIDPDSLHRLVKAFADSGEAPTLEAAEELMDRYGVRVSLDSDALRDQGAQIAALTVLNVATRTFRRNVHVTGPLDFVLTAPGFEGTTLGTFVDWLGIQALPDGRASSWPRIEIVRRATGVGIRPWAAGWCFGLGGDGGWNGWFVPACVAAGALAVSEAFSILRRDNPYAGHRSISVSLWSPGCRDAQGPATTFEVPGLWLVGLGHLGQAYAWTLGFMRPSSDAVIYLQDPDVCTRSSLSTSMLSAESGIGHRKTRFVAHWLEDRGFRTAIVERRFDSAQRVGAAEPRLALFGVDNPAARRSIESGGFRRVVDAGLGSGFRDFRAIRMRTFPGPSAAATLWAADFQQDPAVVALAYKELLNRGAAACGVTMLASRAVGAPFVGCVAAAFVLAELIRGECAGPILGYADLDLRSPESVDVG